MLSKRLKELYKQIEQCPFCLESKNKLHHIYAVGALKPKLMLILINPTYRNLSSQENYKGPRFPFIGVRHFWRVLADGGLIDKRVAFSLPGSSRWNQSHTRLIQRELKENGLFITNIVKCCYPNSDYPNRQAINFHLPFLRTEIQILKPRIIVAFGNLVFHTLTAKSIKLSDYWEKEKKEIYREKISGLNTVVIPCYFPIGRGNPQKAAAVLRNIYSS